MTRRRTVGATVLTGVLLLVPARPASADVVNPVDCQKSPASPRCTVQVEGPGTPGGGRTTGAGTGTTDPCQYERMGGSQAPPGGSQPGAWYTRTCVSQDGTASEEAVWITDGTPDPASLGQRAASQLVLPTLVIRWNPAPPANQIVRVPTWLWVETASWTPQSATASVPGLSVRATATPTQLALTTGDGDSVICNGPGTTWMSGMDPLASSPTCGHTYRRAGSFMLVATVSWSVAWAGGGTSGAVGPLSTTASAQVRVVEAGALNMSGVG